MILDERTENAIAEATAETLKTKTVKASTLNFILLVAESYRHAIKDGKITGGGDWMNEAVVKAINDAVTELRK